MDALGELMEEHRTIAAALDALRRVSKRLSDNENVRAEVFARIFDVLSNFVDRCHHVKEEQVLFPVVREMGPDEAAAVALLVQEHEAGRQAYRAMSGAVAAKDSMNFITNANEYVSVIARHIGKENNLFPKWMSAMTDDARLAILEGFDKVEEQTIGRGRVQEYRRIADELRGGPETPAVGSSEKK